MSTQNVSSYILEVSKNQTTSVSESSGHCPTKAPASDATPLIIWYLVSSKGTYFDLPGPVSASETMILRKFKAILCQICKCCDCCNNINHFCEHHLVTAAYSVLFWQKYLVLPNHHWFFYAVLVLMQLVIVRLRSSFTTITGTTVCIIEEWMETLWRL